MNNMEMKPSEKTMSIKQEAIPLGYKKTEVGIIPNDWMVMNIATTMKLINGYGFKPSQWKKEGLPIIRIQNLNDSNASYNYFSGIVDAKFHIKNGDLLFAWSGSKGVSFGARVWQGQKAILNQHIFKIIPDENYITANFSYFVLRKVQEQVERMAHGFKSSFVHVKKGDLENTPLPIPPKEEQTTIAKVLSDTDALINSLERLIAKKKDIKTATMQQLLTARIRLPGYNRVWHCSELKHLVSTPITDGPHMTPKFYDTGVPFLSVNNLVNNRIDITDLRYISKKDDELFSKKCKPQKGDVLLGKAASVGKVAFVEETFDFNIWSPIALIRTNNYIDPKFLYYQLMSEHSVAQIMLFTNSSSQGNIGMGDIEKIEIRFPDNLKEQTRIATILSDMDSELATLERKLSKSRNLKQGMMQQLLTGRIRLPLDLLP